MKINVEKAYEKYYKEIKNYCISAIRDIHSGEDCAQEVFVALVKKKDSIDRSVDIKLWLLKAANLEVKHYLRRKSNSDILVSDAEIIDTMRSGYYSEIENDSVLEGVIDSDERDFLNKYYMSGKTTDEIAKEHGISPAAIRKRISRIKKKIESSLREDEYS